MACKTLKFSAFTLFWLLCCISCADKNTEQNANSSANNAAVVEPVASDSTNEASNSTPATSDASLNTPSTAHLNILDVSERSRDGKNGIAVTLATELDGSKNIQPFFDIQTAAGQAVDGAWELDSNNKLVWFMNVEPETAYRIDISSKLTAKNQQSLAAPFSSEITTRALRASINFDSQGSVLPLGYRTGLPVVTVNIDAVDVDFFRVQDEHISEFLQAARRHGHRNWAMHYFKNFSHINYSARFDLNPEKNTRTRVDLPLDKVSPLQKAGVYLALMRIPGDYDNPEITWFTRTDIGIHLRQYQNQWLVQAQSLTTGKTLKNVTIELLNSKSELLTTQKTDDNGAAILNQKLNKANTLLARLDNQLTYLDLNQPTLDLSEFELGKRPQLPQEFFIYGPRDLYRPGEVATFAGLLRDGDGQFNHAPVLEAFIQAPNGSKIKEFKWSQQTLGYYQFDWPIPANAATGRWQLVVSGALAARVVYEFNVEEFLPERLKVTVGAGKQRTVVTAFDQPLVVPINSEFLYGAPAAGNRASAFYQTQVWQHPIDDLKNYYFGNVLEQNFTKQQELPDLTLNKQGNGQWTVPANWRAAQSPLKLQVIGSVFESGGRAVTRAHNVLLWPTENLIGIRPNFKSDQNPKPDSQVQFDLVSANVNGVLTAAEQVEVKLIQEDRQYFWEYNDSQGWHWNWTEKEFAVAAETVAIEANNNARVNFAVGWGRYRLEAKNLTTGFITSLRFFAGHDWYYDWKNAQNAGTTRPDKINLALDKTAYQPGETAQLKILPPAAGTALIMVEGDAPLWSQQIDLKAEGATVNIPISEQWQQHNIYVTALLVEPTGTSERITPKRSLGLLHLPLAREQRKLQVEIKAPEKTIPNKTLEVELNLGEPSTSTYVTLAAVDVGVLNISDFATPDAFEHFFGQRRYGTELKDMYGEVIEYHKNPTAKQRFGGDADLARGGKQPQADVQIVSLFSGPVSFDDKGRAKVPLSLPDFNGRLRLMALAFNHNSYGKQDFEVTVASPIVAEIAMPRFLAFGDRSEVALDVQNMTELHETLTLNFNSKGAVLFSEQKDQTSIQKTIELDPKQKVTLKFDVEAVAVDGIGQFELSLKGEHIEPFSRSWQLGVRPAYPAITLRKKPALKGGESFSLSAKDIKDVIPSTLQGTVQVNSIVNINVASQLQNLLGYPYGCLEQTSSKAQPLLYADDAAQTQFGLPKIDNSERLKRIQLGVDRLASFQKANGSFGLWGKDSEEEHWLTVYATEFLIKAQALGAQVPNTLLQKATKRLEFYLQSNGALIGARWSKNNKHYAFATRAYAGYVLSDLNKAPLGSLRTLYQRDFDHAQSALPQVHLALALHKAGDVKRANEAIDKAVKWQPGEREYLADYGSAVRDLGQVVQLLLSHQTHTSEALQMAQTLSDELRIRTWLSTQERTALFLAGLKLGQQPTDWQGQWQLGGGEINAINATSPWVKFLDADALTEGFTFTAGPGDTLFATAFINGYTRTPPPAVDEGIHIERNWYNSEGKLVKPTQVKQGELYLVHLAVVSQERVPDALVVNLLPAGFELENQNLEHAIALDQFVIEGDSVPELVKRTEIKHQEYRDDRYVAALDINRYRQGHLFFLVRAVSPGTFQVPPAIAEDMYRPDIRGVSNSIETIIVGCGGVEAGCSDAGL